ncbi:MAG: hypothetical protein FJ207_13145 [Gemmatimonadetes bacterium]|nr:hypothetical protein [Gemmatimonadota bacterium]
MSTKKRILRDLALAHEPGTPFSFVRPADISGYSGAPFRYQEAVNELLRDRLIEGRTDAEGRLAIALNEHRMDEVRRALKPLWAHPALWAGVPIATAMAVWFAS